MADPPAASGRRSTPSWLVAPGTRDLTSHVDFTTLRREAARVGLATLSLSSQSRFLLDLVERGGLIGDLERPDRVRDRLALKSLLVPGALGSSHSVLVLTKNVESSGPCSS
jgi:SAM-dependent MidA family methyltransferase